MAEAPPYDARAVANLMLVMAKEAKLPPLRPLALQKLLYFAHGFCLIRLRVPLTKGSFEAWQHGPVHPAVYHAFKKFGDQPITELALSRDVMSGKTSDIPFPSDEAVIDQIDQVLRSLGKLTAGRLVDLTHAPEGPWSYVVNKAKTQVALGLRIPDDVTVQRFKFQKVSVSPTAKAGEPDDDEPLV